MGAGLLQEMIYTGTYVFWLFELHISSAFDVKLFCTNIIIFLMSKNCPMSHTSVCITVRTFLIYLASACVGDV